MFRDGKVSKCLEAETRMLVLPEVRITWLLRVKRHMCLGGYAHVTICKLRQIESTNDSVSIASFLHGDLHGDMAISM